MVEAVNSLKATCDTLLSNADELIRLLFNSGRFKTAAIASFSDGSPRNTKVPSTLPQSLQNDKTNNQANSSNSRLVTFFMGF